VRAGWGLVLIGLIGGGTQSPAQQRPERELLPALGLEKGVREIETPSFTLRLSEGSQVAVGLRPKGAGGFDFLPSDRLEARSGDGFYHLGDVTLRVRVAGESSWKTASTAERRANVASLPSGGAVLAAADLTRTLPSAMPVRVVRRWVLQDGGLALLFDVRNVRNVPVEVGALGIPMPFNNIITGRSLEEAHERCSFVDPYIGAQAGYVQVTRLTGTGPTMVVLPAGATSLEAWRLLNEPMRPNQTFEGTMEWMAHSDAYAKNEWKGVEQWNEPTSAVLKPGEVRTYGVRFQPSPSLRQIEDTVSKAGKPVAVGLPGYVLPMDQDARLFLNYGKRVRSMASHPRGALAWSENREGRNGWRGYTVRGREWGRARLSITYEDGTVQTVNYYVIKPASEAVADMGRFLTTKAWFTDENDPFGRAPSAISYDIEADRQVLQDSRVWIAGLGDEGGSGNWLALAMKSYGQPNRDEFAKLEEFVDKVMWGRLQYDEGPNKYGVRKSVFFYEPALVPGFTYDPARNWTSWTSWNKRQSDDIGRGYNYPHVVAAYWSLYRIARNHPGMTQKPWTWYLDQAYSTTAFMTSLGSNGRDRVGYWRLGLMGGTVFLALLEDLKREGWDEKATFLEGRMKERADRWERERYPFLSEMAWDSTGQEEVYAWCDYFGYRDKALVSLNAILAYMPTVPHWGYNGNARRYWDFLYGGKISRIERQIHHYGSGLNALPVLTEYRKNPDDLYLLRVGYGGAMGAISNIDRGGFASAAFHSFPSTLAWDAYSGDYGPSFLGHALNTGTYLVETRDFGWQVFGGRLVRQGEWLRVEPLDSLRRRVYLAPERLYVTLQSGTFEAVEYSTRTGEVRLLIAPGDALTPRARFRIEQAGEVTYRPGLPVEAGSFDLPLGPKGAEVRLEHRRFRS
jgi:hypothetical protein